MSEELRYPVRVEVDESRSGSTGRGAARLVASADGDGVCAAAGGGGADAFVTGGHSGPGGVAPAPEAVEAVEAETETGVVLAAPSAGAWREVLLEYKRRKAQAAPVAVAPSPAAALAPTAHAWTPWR